MADITQTLGFEVQEALAALSRLDQQLVGLEQRLQSAANATGNFNSTSKPILDAFKGIGRLAGRAAVQVQGYAQAAAKAAQVAAPQAPGNLANLVAILSQAQASLKGLVGAANQAQSAINKLGQNATANLKQATKEGDKLMVTFGTLSRVVATQLVVRAMSALRNGLEDSLSSAIGFETQLAQIQTIGGPAVGTLQDVAKQVRSVSEAFNRPIEDVAQGYYNILSNQIEKAADAHLVLVESARLATVAVSSLDDATNALSSIINSYGMSAADAADISGKLFAAVDKGRFTLSEIANTIGRSTTLAHELGVSLEEVLASLATLTISGIKADEAQTLLTNAMRGLLKPTKAMRAAYAELGVANAEVGVATYGFQGFLERLRNTTNGTASEISQLTENIRVGRGVFGLTGDAAEKYRKTLDEIRGAGAESLQSKFKIIMETNAQQVQRELTELRNFFVNDFGIPMLRVIKQTVESFGGIVNIVKSLKDAAIAVVVIVPTFIMAQAALTAALKATTAWTLGLRALIGLRAGLSALWALVAAHPIIAVVAAVGLLTVAIAKWRAGNAEALKTTGDLTEQLRRQHEAFVENSDAIAAAATAEAKKVQAARTETVSKAYQQQFRLVAELQTLYEKDRDNAIAAQEDALDRLKDQLKDRLSLISKVINQLEQKQQGSARIIEKNRKESSNLVLQDEERYLDRQLGRLNDQAKAVKNLQRARELEGRAAQLSQRNDFEGAEDLLKTADQRAMAAIALGETRLKEATTLDEQRAATEAIRQAEVEIDSILKSRLALRQQENEMATAQAKAAEEEIRSRRQQLSEAKNLIEQINKFEVIAKNKDVKFEDRQAARDAVLPLAEQLEEVLSRGNVNLEEFLGIQDLTRQIRAPFESALTDKPIPLLFAVDEAIDQIVSKLETRPIKLKAVVTELEQSSGAKFSIQKGFDDIAVAMVNKQRDLNKAIAEQATLPTQEGNLAKYADLAKNLALEIAVSGKQVDENLGRMLAQVEAATYKALQGEGDWLLRLSTDLGTAAGELTKQAEKTTDATAAESLRNESKKLLELATTLSEIVGTQQEVTRLKAAAPQVEASIQENVRAGQTAQNAQMFVRLDEMMQNVRDGQRVILQQTDLLAPSTEAAKDRVANAYSAIKDSINGAMTAQNGLNVAIRQMPTPTMGIGTGLETKALGGLVRRMRFFESGGVARGTDTIPTMLSPGEFVTSARNARRFLPQLQAINAGIPPAPGPSSVTNNTTVGDIIVNGAQQPTQVAREVMRHIRRETRRGSGRL